jgi:hypothetical protein
MKKRLLLTLGGVIGVGGSASVQAQLIDVQFTGDSVGGAYGGQGAGFVATTTFSGAAVIGSAGDIWNGIADGALNFGVGLGAAGSTYPNGINTPTPLALNYTTGAASSVTLSLTGNSTFNDTAFGGTNQWATAGSPYEDLFNSVIANSTAGAPSYMDFSGLAKNTPYELIVYSSGNDDGRTSTFTVNGVTETSQNALGVTMLNPVFNYDVFETISSATGTIDLSYGGVGSGLAESDINGMQLLQQVPEPTTLGLLGLAGVPALLRRRRA